MKKLIKIIILTAFLVHSVLPGYAQAGGTGVLPEPGTMVRVSPAFFPAVLKGVKIDVKDPFRFDFILSAGDAPLPVGSDEVARLVRYFMASLAVPENDLWVNLSPYEKDRIVPDVFGVTDMGRDLLAQDYLLKQITASLMYPEGETGKVFWAEIYKKAQEQFGTTDIPVDTFNKVWIVPAKAVVYEDGNKALVVEAGLKVMLESDYTAMEHHVAGTADQAVSPAQDMAKEVVRSVVIPVLEKEVNAGRNFAQLRQVYYSLILAKWYKENLKQSILTRQYADRQNVKGIEIDDKGAKEEIYARYLDAFKKGAFNYIRNEVDLVSQEAIPRKYFSGGVGFQFRTQVTHDRAEVIDDGSQEFNVNVLLQTGPSDSSEALPVERMKDWHKWREANKQASHGTLYLNADGTRVLKIMNKVRGVNDEHVREFYRLIQELPEKLEQYGYAGPVKVQAVELVRTDDGRLALRKDFKAGSELQGLIKYRLSEADSDIEDRYHAFPRYPFNAELVRITADFLDAVDAVTGGKSDRRSRNDLSNFILTDAPGRGYEIINIDPVSMIKVLKSMAAERRSLADVLKGLFTSKQPQGLPGKDDGSLPVVDMKDWKLWFWPNLRAGQSRVYISKDKKQVLKIFRLKGVREEHVREIQNIIAGLPQRLKENGYQGPVEVVVPKLVRVNKDGLGLVMEKKDGHMFETTARRRLSVHGQKELQKIAEDFFTAVDSVAGEGMADRRGIAPIGDRSGEVNYWNFIWDKDADGKERIYNFDPIDMLPVMKRMAPGAEDLAQGTEDVSVRERLDARMIIENMNDREEKFVHARTGEAYSFVAVHDSVLEEGDMVKVFLKDAQGVLSKEYVALFEVYPDRDLLGQLEEDFRGVVFEKEGSEEMFDLQGGGLGAAFHKVLSRSLPAGAALEAYIFHRPTRDWLNNNFQFEGDRLFIVWDQVEEGGRFTVWDDHRYEVVDDVFDAQGRPDRRALEPGQAMLSDVLATSPMGKIWTKDSGFHALQLFVQSKEAHASGLLALKWWVRNAGKKANDRSRAHLMPFFKAKNDPDLIKDGADKAAAPEQGQAVILQRGARMFSSADLGFIERVRQRGKVVEVFNSGGVWSNEIVVPQEDMLWTFFDNTPAEFVEETLGISFKDLIVKAKAHPRRTFIWVDWGCGDGTAVDQLAFRLTMADVPNVRLFAFGNVYSPKWELASSRVTFILDTADNFFKYFKDRSISLLFSHFGLTHFREKGPLLGYVQRLASRVAPAGEVFMNVTEKALLFSPGEVASDWTLEQTGDDGMHLSRVDKASTGGIDLNANNMNIQTTGSGVRFDIESGIAPADQVGLDSLSPVIVSITPLKNAHVFLETP